MTTDTASVKETCGAGILKNESGRLAVGKRTRPAANSVSSESKSSPAANLQYYPTVPWAMLLTALYLWLFWQYLKGAGPPESTAESRRTSLRANRVSGCVWVWSLLAGGLGIVALVFALRVANRMVVRPQQQLPDLTRVPEFAILSLLLMAAPVAGIVEEAAFRGYMQGPIERH